MDIDANIIEKILLDYAHGIFGNTKVINSDTAICRDLGLCDEDLWEMIEHVLDHFNYPSPTVNEPFLIEIHQDDVRFSNLSAFLSGKLSSVG